MLWKTAVCALFLLPGMAARAEAADATAAGADTVRTSLERYLGRGPVAVTPAGAAYRIDIDLKKMLAVLEPFGLALDPVTVTMTAAPQEDGLWHVTGGGLPIVTVHMQGATTSVAVNNHRFDGLFDPKLPAFTKATSSYDSVSVGATGADAPTQVRQLDHGQQLVTGTPAGDGVVDLKVAQTNSDYAQDIAFDGAEGGQRVSIKSGPTTDGLAVGGLRIRALTDLWAFLVAHPTTAALTGAQADLKALLRQALPVFGHWSQDGSLEAVSVATPIGPVLARSVATHLDLAGLTADGRATLGIKAEGLTIPAGMLPVWAPALLPTAVDLTDSVSGYRLDQAAATAITALDLGAAQPLPPDTMAAIGTTVAPRDQLTVTIGDSRITTPTVAARFGGEVHFAGPVPSFKVTAHAAGLDKAIAAIQGQAAQDPLASQAIALVMLVKGYGRAEPDGGLAWDIMADGTGAILVNGVPLPMGQPK